MSHRLPLDQLKSLTGAALDQALGRVDRGALSRSELALWYQLHVRAARDEAALEEAVRRCAEGLAALPGDPVLSHQQRELAAMNRVDAALTRSTRQAGGYHPEHVEKTLRALDLSSLRPEEQVAWHQALAAAAMQGGNRPVALQRYREGFAAHPQAPELAFGLAQELQAQGRPEEAFDLADRAMRMPGGLSGKFLLRLAGYAFLWNMPQRGLPFAEAVVHATLSLPFDTHVWWTRGLPAFHVAWRVLLGLTWQAGGPVSDRLREQARAADGHEPASCFGAELEAVVQGKPELLRAALDAQRGELARGRIIQALHQERDATVAAATIRELVSGPYASLLLAALARRLGDAPAEGQWAAGLPSGLALEGASLSDVVWYLAHPYLHHLSAGYRQAARGG